MFNLYMLTYLNMVDNKRWDNIEEIFQIIYFKNSG